MSEIKLLRCPFCGGEAELLKGQCEIDNYVMCLECRSKTKLYNTKASAIKAWNTRKPMQNIVERLEEEHMALFSAKQEISFAMYRDKSIAEKARVLQEKQLSIHQAIEIVKEEGGLNDQ